MRTLTNRVTLVMNSRLLDPRTQLAERR